MPCDDMAVIFLTGGAFEGKKRYAKEQYPDAWIIADYHLKVKQQLLSDMDPMKEVRKLFEKIRQNESGKTVVISSDELGCGIIPLDKQERRWRECSGRVNCYIAAHAEQVYRMIAGIPQRLK